jgi:hypothetical protein
VFPPTMHITSVVAFGFAAFALFVRPKTIIIERKELIKIERFENLFIANSASLLCPTIHPVNIESIAGPTLFNRFSSF